jgi:hypothetical protein
MFILWFSLPIAVGALGAALLGIFSHSAYARETSNWAAQAVAQDVANLVAYSALILLAILGARGSLRAYLAWIGLLGYSVYTFAIYAFAVHFGPLFLLYVAVFGLSIYALVVGLSRLDFERVKESFGARVPRRFASYLLMAIGGFFYLLWLSSVVPALVAGRVPDDVVKAGLLVNPVHVLDMAVFLPAMLLAGALLLHRRAMGYVLAPLVLTAACTISLGIMMIQPVSAVRGETAAWGVGAAVAVLAVVELVTLIRFLLAVDPEANVSSVVRRNQGAQAAEGRQPEARSRGPERSTPGEDVTADPVFEGGHQEEN